MSASRSGSRCTIRAAQVTPGGFGPRAVARMKPGTDRAALVAQLEPLARRVQQRLGGPAPYVRIMERHRPVVKPLREQLVGKIATPLWILLGTVGIVFLIACANVANLFTVRAENRRRDLVVRRALGAGRGDLVRSQVTEALLLAAAGGAAGALIAWAGVPLLVRAAPDAVAGGFGGAPIPGLATAGLDLTALLFTAGISVLAACAFGLLPAFRFSGSRLGSIQQAGRGIVGRRSLTRDALVVVQTASALVLLVGSALLMRSFWQLSHVDAGYDTKDIFTFQIAASRPDLNDRAVDVEVSVHVHGSPEGAAGRRIRWLHHHAPAGRGRRHARTSPLPGSRRAAPKRRSFASRAPAARTSRRWGSSCCAAATSSGSRKNRACRM